MREIFSAANFERLKGGMGVGHVRYPTVGSGGGEDAQPFTVNYPHGIVMAHNGNVANYKELSVELARSGKRHLLSNCDVEIVLNVFANALAREGGEEFTLDAYYAAVREVYAKVRGAYSVVGYIAGQGLFAFRDRFAANHTDATTSRFGDREDDVQAAADKMHGHIVLSCQISVFLDRLDYPCNV